MLEDERVIIERSDVDLGGLKIGEILVMKPTIGGRGEGRIRLFDIGSKFSKVSRASIVII